jgi:hypothetical protein
VSQAGLPDFSTYNIPKRVKCHKTVENISTKKAIKYVKWLENRPNGHKIYQHLSLQDPPKLTQNGIFGSKRNHLATLVTSAFRAQASLSDNYVTIRGDVNPGLPDFSWCMIPKPDKMYQMYAKSVEWSKNIPSVP